MAKVNVRFPNLSKTPRTEIGYAALPFYKGEWDGLTPLVARGDDGKEVDCYIEPMGVRWEDGSVRYGKLLARVTVDSGQTKVLTVSDGRPVIMTPFQLSHHFNSPLGIGALRLSIKTASGWLNTTFNQNLTILEDNRLRKVFQSHHRMGDFVVDLKLYLMSNQQLVKFELSVTGSNPATTEVTYPLEEIRLIVDGNSYINLRGIPRRGIEVVAPYKDFRLMKNDYFGNGQKQAWYGEIVPALDFTNQNQVSNALAAVDYVFCGMSTDWAIKEAFASLLAAQKPDVLGVQGYWNQLISQFGQYHDFMQGSGNAWDDYMMGVTKTPGQTGAQEDFGCLEAGAILYMGAAELLDPIYFMATEETKRPGHYYEADGSEVKAANHPNWIVWDGVTHWHAGVSTDRLGKSLPNYGGNTHGWNGKDWEHHSSNLLSFASLMTGSYLLLDEVNHEIESYLSGHTLPSEKPNYSTNGRFAARAFGRTHHAMCNHYLLVGRQDLLNRMIARFNECVVNQWDGATRSPVKNWEHIRDDRVLGSTVDAWVPWNNSLGFVGAVALYNITRLPQVKELMVGWGNTIMNYGWRATIVGGATPVVTALAIGGGVRWNEDGSPITPEQYNDPAYFVDGGGLSLWGLQVFEIIRNNPTMFGQQNADKATMYAQYMRSQHIPNPNAPFSEFGQWVAIKLS
jgi:hypothetical protein